MYPSAMRQHILNIRATENLTIEETAKRFDIGVATLSRWIKNPEPKLKRNKPCPKINMEQLKQDIIDRPDDYQHERAQRFGVSRHGIYAALKRLGITRKKNTISSKGLRRKKAYILPAER